MPPDDFHPLPAWLDPRQAEAPGAERYLPGPALGQGGVGEVVEAWDRVLRRTVALKVLKQLDPASLLRFMHEARAQSRVVHPCICQIYDVDSSERGPRIAMQLVRGPTLADAAPDLAEAEVVRIMARVADAVDAAHRLNLIHRDLKPSNILLERDGQGGWTPYVCDFGLALDLGEPTLTGIHQVHGTPAYMAPEQIRGDRARIGPATDVYALGGTLRAALRGGLEPGLPRGPKPGPAAGDLDRILGKCLAPDPAARYPTAAALAEDLWRVSRGEPVRGPDPPPARGRGALLTGLLALGAVAALAAGLALTQRRLAAAGQRQAAWARFYLGEADGMERALALEQTLPGHDLRPAHDRLRARLRAIQDRLPALDGPALGPAHYALGRGRLLLDDPGGALAELDQAWALGFRGPEAACLRGCALAAAHGLAVPEREYAGEAPGPDPPGLADLLQQGQGPDGAAEPYGAALACFLRRDFARTAAAARAGLGRDPWRGDLAALEIRSLDALGRQAAEAGDALLAEARFSSALDAAQAFLARDPSHEAVHHARLEAARDLAALKLGQGQPALPFLERCRQLAAEALALDPDAPALQDDWLQVQLLRASCLSALGRDPGPALSAAAAFLDGRGGPLAAGLRADRMLVHWLLAERARRRGADPRPELAQALRDPGHTPFLGRDYLWDVLTFQARDLADRGADPRPALAGLQARMAPFLVPEAPGSTWAAAARAWSLRSRWEAAHGLDPGPSQRRARDLLERAGRPGHRRTLYEYGGLD